MSAPAALGYLPCTGLGDPSPPPQQQRRPWPIELPASPDGKTEQLLEQRADKAMPRRFSGAAITGFGALA